MIQLDEPLVKGNYGQAYVDPISGKIIVGHYGPYTEFKLDNAISMSRPTGTAKDKYGNRVSVGVKPSGERLGGTTQFYDGRPAPKVWPTELNVSVNNLAIIGAGILIIVIAYGAMKT